MEDAPREAVRASLEWQAGDNVVLAADEYPSVVAPLALRRRAEFRLADMMDAEAVARVVDSRTRMIAVSAVESCSISSVV